MIIYLLKYIYYIKKEYKENLHKFIYNKYFK